MKKIKSFLSSFILLLLGSNGYVSPQVELDRFPISDNTGISTSLPENLPPYRSNSLFPLALGQTEIQFRELINKETTSYTDKKTHISGEPYLLSKKRIDSTTELLILIFDFNFGEFRELKNKPEMMGLYILKEGQITGYACTDIHVIVKPQEFIPWVQITHLPQEKTFLPGFSLQTHPERQIQFYRAKRHDSYVERYATLNLPKADKTFQSNIVLRSFYPQEYESVLKPLLKQSLESILWRYGDMFEYL